MPQTTRPTRHIKAPPEHVYRLLLDRHAVQHWKVPDGMSSEVHVFEPRLGGAFRVSLTYVSPDAQGKTSAHTDTYHGHFVSLVPGSLVVEAVEFESSDPSMAGRMTITYTLSPSAGGTDLLAVHEGCPMACPRPTTSSAGACPWTSSRRWRSRRVGRDCRQPCVP